MNPQWLAVRAGGARGGVEFRQSLTNAQDLWNQLFFPIVAVVVMFFLRGSTVPGTNFSIGSMAIPSMLGMTVAFNGLLGVATMLTVEREDGTLLRAKAIPNGMLGYLVSKVVTVSGQTVFGLVIILIPGLLLFHGLAVTAGSLVILVGVSVLGLIATLPIGAIIGSMLSSPRNLGLAMLPIMGLVAISGIFYPITAMPDWLQAVAQVFPIYWLALGMRSALLPENMVAVEIGESWRHLEMIGVLGVWAVIGYFVAPIVLRRMARRESGSSVAARREKAMQRIT
ncbi:MAG: ABC transporter permease [Pseudonocardiaceae bacterium]|nr:ABC transporter permease [Pseudonocardiaceae bacterium]